MARIRVSTTVDEAKLTAARHLHGGNDAAVLDAALDALATAHREAQIDEAYEAWDRIPADTPDAWGDLASFREEARRS